MASNKTIKPGTELNKDVKLFVKDANGNTIGEINVPAGHRVPPTRIENADSYSLSK